MSLNLPEHVRRVYVHFGFPVGEWQQRYRLDFTSGQRNRRSHVIYRAIASSLKHPDSNAERANLRYYQLKIDAARALR